MPTPQFRAVCRSTAHDTQFKMAGWTVCRDAAPSVTFWSKSSYTSPSFHQRIKLSGTALAVQWLRFCAATAGDTGSIPGRGTKIPHVAWPIK